MIAYVIELTYGEDAPKHGRNVGDTTLDRYGPAGTTPTVWFHYGEAYDRLRYFEEFVKESYVTPRIVSFEIPVDPTFV